MNDEVESGQVADERGEKSAPPPDVLDAQAASPSAGDEQSDEGEAASGGDKLPFWRRPAVWIAAIAVVVIIVAGAAGVVAFNAHTKDEALSNCRQYAAQIRKLAGAPLDDKVIEAAKADKKGVADGKTWETLHGDQKKLSDLAQRSVPACDAVSRTAAQKQEGVAAASLKSLKLARRAVGTSAKAVLASRDVKTLKDVRDALTAKVGQAKQLLDSSAGNVADDATRTVLSQQVDAANRLIGNEQSKLADLQQAAQTLDGVVNAVNASVQAKAAADAEAAQAAAQAQAEATQKRASTRSKSSGSARGGSSGSGSRNSTTSVPQIHGWVATSNDPGAHDDLGGHHDIMCFGPHDCLDRNGNQVDGNGNIISGN
ncbi:hypothetical protein PT279_01525 [Bifidobacterium sp. ESL0784]|uniref:hypothetical protein n=1 Tax=Bifidobacterium sp. ESL0784 TaxID=2983231 RepID=UPI0023F895BC|nr:hypothetical protein [Bifidobacterium sp. ESL0784]MDF7640279.1 hypothetical protein [Bifidobacterium sp. ESL0784]